MKRRSQEAAFAALRLCPFQEAGKICSHTDPRAHPPGLPCPFKHLGQAEQASVRCCSAVSRGPNRRPCEALPGLCPFVGHQSP